MSSLVWKISKRGIKKNNYPFTRRIIATSKTVWILSCYQWKAFIFLQHAKQLLRLLLFSWLSGRYDGKCLPLSLSGFRSNPSAGLCTGCTWCSSIILSTTFKKKTPLSAGDFILGFTSLWCMALFKIKQMTEYFDIILFIFFF